MIPKNMYLKDTPPMTIISIRMHSAHHHSLIHFNIIIIDHVFRIHCFIFFLCLVRTEYSLSLSDRYFNHFVWPKYEIACLVWVRRTKNGKFSLQLSSYIELSVSINFQLYLPIPLRLNVGASGTSSRTVILPDMYKQREF